MRRLRILAPFVWPLLSCSGSPSPADSGRFDSTPSGTDAAREDIVGIDVGDLPDVEPTQDSGPRDAGPDARRDGATPPTARRFWWNTEIVDPSNATRPIWGDGHVHSDFSGDGTRPALDMMNRAKSLGADFVWITDHGRTPSMSGGITEGEYDTCTARGVQATDANQFAGCGIEYRLGYTRPNGSKVYEAWHQVVHGFAANQFGELLSSNGYTSWNGYESDLARSGAYATVTHPSGPTAWYNDDDSAYRDTDPSHHPNTELIELNGGDDNAANGNNLVDGINVYFRFLNDGWQLSPVWDSDMHHFYDGAEKAKGYGAWVDGADWSAGRYRPALRSSAQRHNTFANHPGDEKNYIRMVSLAPTGDAPEAMMGSTLPPRASVRLRIRASITGSNERWLFKLYTSQHSNFDDPLRTAGAAVTDVVTGGTEQDWTVTLDTTGVRWVVAYASPGAAPPGSSTEYLVSAPIWFNNQ